MKDGLPERLPTSNVIVVAIYSVAVLKKDCKGRSCS